MKKIVITDPCYLSGVDIDEMKKDISADTGSSVTLDVTEDFFNKLKQRPLVELDTKDNWYLDGGTYWWCEKFSKEEAEFVGYHYNDAGMTCIADYDNLHHIKWKDVLKVFRKNTKQWQICKSCKGSKQNENLSLDESEKIDTIRHVKSSDIYSDKTKDILLGLLSYCPDCHGRGLHYDYNDTLTLNDYKFFLMIGSTFIGDVGAAVYVKRVLNEIKALAIDVNSFSFDYENEE